MGQHDDESGRDELELSHGSTKFRARGYDLLVILVFLVCTFNAVFLWQHMEAAKDASEILADTNRETARVLRDTNKEVARSLNLATCLMATKEENKEAEYMRPNSFCNRMATK